ncbi:hypothetical protein GCM10020001_091370 [Nonomuraea salmonea]
MQQDHRDAERLQRARERAQPGRVRPMRLAERPAEPTAEPTTEATAEATAEPAAEATAGPVPGPGFEAASGPAGEGAAEAALVTSGEAASKAAPEAAPEAAVELQGEAAFPGHVHGAPDQVVEQDRVGERELGVGEAAVGGGDHGAPCGPGRLQVEAAQRARDGLEPDRARRPGGELLAQVVEVVDGELGGGGDVAFDVLDADQLVGGGPAVAAHLGGAQQLAVLRGGVDEERHHPGPGQQPPVDLPGAQLLAASQVDGGRRVRLKVEQRPAPPPYGDAERRVEVGGAGRRRVAGPADEQLEAGPAEVVAPHPVAVVVDERGEQRVTHRAGQVYGEHAETLGEPRTPPARVLLICGRAAGRSR